MKPAPGVE
jgi:Ca2+-binding EF-hand superfamily protein